MKSNAEEKRLETLTDRLRIVKKIQTDKRYVGPGEYECKIDRLAENKLRKKETTLTEDRDKECRDERQQASLAQQARREAERASRKQGHGLKI